MEDHACKNLQRYAEKFFSSFLQKYNFSFSQCSTHGSGQHESFFLMYTSEYCNLLFSFEDGSYNCSLATKETPLPPVDRLFYLNGEKGWYEIILLIEYLKGDKILTKKVIESILSGSIDTFEWESRQLADNEKKLIEMFSGNNITSWSKDFEYFVNASNAF